MAPDPLKRSRQRQGLSLAFHTIGAQGYFSSVQPPFQKFLDPPLFRGFQIAQIPMKEGAALGIWMICTRFGGICLW